MENQKVTAGGKDNIVKAWNFLCLALYAFLGLAVEVVLVLVIEPVIYRVPMSEWTEPQHIALDFNLCFMGAYRICNNKNC